MAKKANRITKLIQACLWGMLVLCLLLASLPAWFPWVARPLLAQLGMQYRSYERLGLSAFELRDLTMPWGASQFQARQVECVLPTVWIWRKLTGSLQKKPSLFIRHAILRLDARTNAPAAASGSLHSTAGMLAEIQQRGLELKQYLPVMRLDDGALEWSSTRLLLPGAEWQDGTLKVQLRSTNWPAPIHISARLMTHQALALSLQWPAHQLALRGKFKRQLQQWEWQGTLDWLTNQAQVSAAFTTNSWWPAHGSLHATQVCVPAALAQLKRYQDLRASLALELVSNQFNLQATGFALPTTFGRGLGLPPLHAAVHLRGDPDSVTLEQFHLQAPFAQASLTNALGIKRTGELKKLAAQLHLSVNLNRLPGVSMTGKAHGDMRVELQSGRQPVAHFRIAGKHVGVSGFKIKSARMAGKFVWPKLTLDELAITLADGSALRAHGTMNLATKELQSVHWQARGAFLQPYLSKFRYQTLAASGQVSGPLTNLVQAGNLTVNGLMGGILKPVQAQVQWQAKGARLKLSQVKLQAGNSVLTAEATAGLGKVRKGAGAATIQSMVLRRKDRTVYSLQQPCSIYFQRMNASGKLPRWELTLDHFNWHGNHPEKKLDLAAKLTWPTQGTVRLDARQVALDDFTDFVQSAVSQLEVAKLDLAGNWSNSPVQLTAGINASLKDQAGSPIAVHGQVKAGKDLQIDKLALDSDFGPAVTLKGVLPLQIVPTATNHWFVLNHQQTFHLTASSQAGTNDIALPLGTKGKLRLANAQFQAQATGTLAKPTIALQLAVANLAWGGKTNSMLRPQLNHVQASATVTPEAAKLLHLTFDVDNQPVSAAGQWPLPETFWDSLWTHPSSKLFKQLDWRTASAQLRVHEAKLATFARYAPKVLTPAGQLDLNLGLSPGGKLHGRLTITNAETRPLASLPPIRNIGAQIHFEGDHATLTNCAALLGGQLVTVAGKVDFPLRGPFHYAVHLTGTNLPLARQLEFLLRGDLDLKLQGGTASPTTLSGTIKLRHGLYVRYLSDLFWSGPKRPAVEPPYFSITNQPFANWKLDLVIAGDHFLHVQTPVLTCVASAHAQLNGTLKTPVLTGTARINSGQLDFPFGSLQVDDGYLTLNGNDPRGPTLEFHASGMAYNYEVHLDVTGPAKNANVIFSSTPPMSSEAILLLLTAGQVPQNQYTFSTSARAGKLATFLGKDWLGRFTGNFGGRPRWVITSGQHVSEQGRLTYSVEYRLTKRWSIIGEYDQFDQYSANLKWRIISR